MHRDFELALEEICFKDPRYHYDAYVFVMEALSYTQKKFRIAKHVSGDELLTGLRELLLEKFGPLAMTVLNHWGVKNTEDFGHMVFNLVDNNVLSKTDEDKLDSFREAFDFAEVFIQGYRKQLHKKVSRMRST